AVIGNPRTGAAQGNRRRWQVRSNPADPARRPSPRQDAAPRRPVARPHNFAVRDDAPRPQTQPYEDWQEWDQRSPASQWQDWDRAAPSPDPSRIPERQRRAQAQAEETFEDIATGWDPRSTQTTDRPSGVSPVDDALDEIAEGWEDWEDPEAARQDNAPESRPIYEVQRSPESVSKSGTHYSYRYRSADDFSRRAKPPADDGAEPVEAATTIDAEPDPRLDTPEVEEEGVYDADYRVIIPPSRPLEDDPERDDDHP
ncbi:MAG: hypothetical protein HC812_14930, partial [Leptolyngbya sp. RL_3_1]|nr:hypothetical protein [Leptolyngbya sp. RL_3_1]